MIDSINTYVVENFGAVQLEEMVHQIHDILSERTDFSMSKEMGRTPNWGELQMPGLEDA